MKTRTLLLWALVCGLAIMFAGAALLLQLGNSQDAEAPVPLGERVVVGDVTATVVSSQEEAGVLTVTLELDAPVGIDATTGFRLIAAGRPVLPNEVVCADVCVAEFGVAEADNDSRQLIYQRGEDRARWVLG